MPLPAPNYDEPQVPSYRLPELLLTESGQRITTAAQWQSHRRPELLRAFQRYVYGDFRARAVVSARMVVDAAPACGNAARRSELDVELHGARASQTPVATLRLLVFTPPGAGPFPAFLGLNLFGNHTVHPDPAIRLARGWLPENVDLGLSGHQASDASRGMHAGRFSVEMLTARGYALVTAYVGDAAPDSQAAFRAGVYSLLSPEQLSESERPGVISAWAFALSRMLDACSALPRIDTRRVAVFGHSRLGKAALWAAAQDERFALAISNQSGCVGAALSRRCFGERLLHINERFPHWFCTAFHGFNGREHDLPVDQHQLLALLAPRPLYVASALGDRWADPEGERLACQAASPAYELFGLHGLAATPNTSTSHIGYHARPGRHDITPRDLWHYLDFAQHHLRDAR